MSDKRVFNSIEEINELFGVELKLPENIPEGCNVLCYKVIGLHELNIFGFYRETEEGLYICSYHGDFTHSSISLDDEVRYDQNLSTIYVYLRLKDENEVKEKFTPERLLGVKTSHGYILDVGCRYITTTSYMYCEKDELKFYISDDSDETVSYDEYVDRFYER